MCFNLMYLFRFQMLALSSAHTCRQSFNTTMSVSVSLILTLIYLHMENTTLKLRWFTMILLLPQSKHLNQPGKYCCLLCRTNQVDLPTETILKQMNCIPSMTLQMVLNLLKYDVDVSISRWSTLPQLDSPAGSRDWHLRKTPGSPGPSSGGWPQHWARRVGGWSEESHWWGGVQLPETDWTIWI